jgi:hypothetical protein
LEIGVLGYKDELAVLGMLVGFLAKILRLPLLKIAV